MKTIAWALMLALLGLGSGCAGREASANQLEVLDSAYKSGVVNREEYQTKRAALMAQSNALTALDRARDAGLLTPDEYGAKRAAILAAAPPPPVAPGPAPIDATLPSAPIATAPPTPTAAPAPPQRATADEASGHTFRMKMAKATDSQGFERPMTSAAMLVPVDWQSQGVTTWNLKDKCNTVQTTLRASGPDGRGVEVFPAFAWVWADNPQALQMTAAQTAQMGSRPCDVMQPMAAADYLRRNLAKLRPNAQLAGIEQAPKLMELLQQQARKTEQLAVQYRLQQRVRPDAVKGRVRYSLNGKAMEEWVIVATVTTGTLGQGYDARTMQLRPSWSYNCAAYVIAERAPQGQLEASEKLFELIVTTYRADPAWQARVTQTAQNVQRTELKGVQDRSAIVARNADDIANIRRQQFENQQRTQDRTAEGFSQMTRGVESYRNPDTGETVELSNLYGNAWVNNRGEYLLSDQPGFDPSVTFKQDWKPLEHVKQ